MVDPLFQVAQNLANELAFRRQRAVFAESCTAGLASATLARVPGISAWHCGSAVVYRLATKSGWLGVSDKVLETPGPVSAVVAEQMATGVLLRTPEAEIAGAITGHLGPGAPADQDGLIWLGLARRTAAGTVTATTRSVVLPATIPDELRAEQGAESLRAADPPSLREWRQRQAALILLQTLVEFVQGQAG